MTGETQTHEEIKKQTPEELKAEKLQQSEEQQELSEKLIADGILKKEERDAVKDAFNNNKETLKVFILQEKTDFIESDFGALSKALVGEKNIAKINHALGVPGDKYSIDTFKAVIKFQKDHSINRENPKNTLKVDGIIGQQTLKEILGEQDDSSFENLQELKDKAINIVLDSCFDKLESKEGIDLSIDGMYEHVVEVLDLIEDSLSDDNPLKKHFPALKENFFMPKENGKKTIEIALNKLLETDKQAEEKTNIQIEDVRHVVLNSVGTLFDIAKNSTPEEINKLISEFQKMPAVKEFTEKIPDFNVIFTEVLPSIIKTVDKQEFLNNLGNFFDNISPSLQTIIEQRGTKLDKAELKQIKLNLIRETAHFLNNSINEKSIEETLKQASKLSFIKNNAFANDLMGLIGELPANKKLETFKNINNFFIELTDPDLNTDDETLSPEEKANKDKKFHEVTDKFAKKLTEIGKEIGAEKILDFLKKHNLISQKELPKQPHKETLGDKIIGITARVSPHSFLAIKTFELGEFIVKNYDRIIEALDAFIKNSDVFKKFTIDRYEDGEHSVDELLKHAINEDLLGKVIQNMGGKFAESLNVIGKINLVKIIKEARNSFIETIDIGGEGLSEDKKDKITPSIETLSKASANKIIKESYKAIKEKIQEATQNEGKESIITKQELIEIGLNSIKTVLKENPTILVDILKEAGVNIENIDGKKLNEAADYMLSHPQMKDIISNIITMIHSKIDNKEDILLELKKLALDTNENFLQEALDNNGDIAIDVLVDTLFDKIINTPEGSKILFNAVKTKLHLEGQISETNAVEIGNILKKHLNPEKLKDFIKPYKELIKNPKEFSNEDTTKIAFELYNLIEDKDAFLQDLFENVIKTPEANQILANLISQNLDIKIPEGKTLEVVNLVTYSLDKTQLKDFVDLYINLLENDGKISQDELMALGGDFYDMVKNKNDFLQKLSDKNIINNVLNSDDKADKTHSPKEDEKQEETKEKIEITDSMIIAGIDAIYDTHFEAENDAQFTQTCESLLKQFGLENILELDILGQNIGEISYEFFSCIKKEDLTQILISHKNTLNNSINKKHDISDLGDLGVDTLKVMDVKKLQDLLKESGNKLSTVESMGVDLADEIQAVVRENTKEIKDANEIGEKLFNLYNSPIKIEEGTQEAEDIREDGEKIFNVMHLLISKLDNDYLDDNLVFEDNDNENSENSNSTKENNKNSILTKLKEDFGSAFVGNNLWFLFANCVDALYARYGGEPGQLINDYFKDDSNKENFGETMRDFMINSSANK
ncbi:MAG: peptidoglycan-binding protein [Candidatus Gracilibacteria bacterium]|nr:peptidoglycan-binding protein [Candidatus Gracilibacteria bacterium]